MKIMSNHFFDVMSSNFLFKKNSTTSRTATMVERTQIKDRFFHSLAMIIMNPTKLISVKSIIPTTNLFRDVSTTSGVGLDEKLIK